MKGNVYFKGTASIDVAGLEKENFLNFIKLEVAVAEAAVQLLQSFNPVRAGLLKGHCLVAA